MKKQKEKVPVVNLYLDTRREKAEGNYPVKLRVYFDYKTRMYFIGKDLTEDEFNKSYLGQKPRDEYKTLKQGLLAYELKAVEIIKELTPFNFELFEKLMFRNTGDGNNVFYHYSQYIKQLEEEGRPGTASSYHLSQRSIKAFIKEITKNEAEILPFAEVTPSFLNKYEKWMLAEGNGLTTVGIYLRAFRSIFNIAITSKDVKQDIYPFGKQKEGKYSIPSGQNTKKGLSKETLKALFQHPVAEGSPQQKAKDFFFFSYQCNGMNVRDIAGLQYKNIKGQTLSFIRNKTKLTTRTKQKQISVAVTDFVKGIISKYGNKQESPETFVFPVFNSEMTEADKLKATQNFTRLINQHLKLLAKAAGVEEGISTYWARHSYTTNAIRSGASMEYIQESLGHQNLSTTMNYWGGFEETVKRDIAEKLMDFE